MKHLLQSLSRGSTRIISNRVKSSRSENGSNDVNKDPDYKINQRKGSPVSAIFLGLLLGLGIMFVHAEYDNGPFRRKVESQIPFASNVLRFIDRIIDPMFGRARTGTTEKENLTDDT